MWVIFLYWLILWFVKIRKWWEIPSQLLKVTGEYDNHRPTTFQFWGILTTEDSWCQIEMKSTNSSISITVQTFYTCKVHNRLKGNKLMQQWSHLLKEEVRAVILGSKVTYIRAGGSIYFWPLLSNSDPHHLMPQLHLTITSLVCKHESKYFTLCVSNLSFPKERKKH